MSSVEDLMAKHAANDNEKAPEDMELEELVEWIREQRSRRDKIVATTELTHSDAYNKAIKKLLKDEKGDIDYNKLDDADTQLKLVREMTKHYLEAAKEYFKVDIDTEDLENEDSLKADMLLKAYAGVTKGYLHSLISQHRSGYTLRKHNEMASDLVDQIKKELTGTIYAPLKGEHAEDVVKHIKADEFLDHERMDRGDLVTALETYFANDVVSPKMFKGQSYLKHGKHKAAANDNAPTHHQRAA